MSFSVFASSLKVPNFLTFDSSGNLYCSNNQNGTISKINSSGFVTPFASGLAFPSGLAFRLGVDSHPGYLYCANFGNGTISQIDLDTNEISTFVFGLSGPYGLAFDSSGNLYSTSNNSIVIIDSGGSWSAFVSELNGNPYGLAFHSEYLYCSLGNGTIVKINSEGSVFFLLSD